MENIILSACFLGYTKNYIKLFTKQITVQCTLDFVKTQNFVKIVSHHKVHIASNFRERKTDKIFASDI